MQFTKTARLDNVCYEIRGPALDEAARLEEEGHTIIHLNTGNPAAFGLNAPDELIRDMIQNLKNAQGYCNSKGIFPARKAIMQHCQRVGIFDVDVDDIYIGNGVSELIMMSMQALLNPGDEILVPAPDYPLWTAAVNLSGGKAVHYLCDESQNWYPDLDDLRSKITDKTRGLVIISPNNPTGAVYPKEILEEMVKIAVENELILYSDEIYDKITYEGAKHIPVATLTDEVLVITFGGLSKSYRAAGFRAGWMILSGNKRAAKDYIEGLTLCSSMRLCSNVPAQYAIQTSLGGYQSINDLVAKGGRLRVQRDYAYERLAEIPGVSCVKPQGALYLFPKFDTEKFNMKSDMQFIFDFLVEKKVLVVQGTGFNWPTPDHVRIVFLPNIEELKEVFDRLEDFLDGYKQK